MTSIEVVHTVRLLLDDTKLSFFTLDVVLGAIREAQNLLLLSRYQAGEERCLRTLYRQVDLRYGDTLPGDYLWPRGCIVYPDTTTETGIVARWRDYALFLNRSTASYSGTTRHCTYTIHDNRFFYDGLDTSQTTARLYYIRQPEAFGETNALEVPDEYHFDVASIAASLLGDIDVNETEREGIENLNTLDPKQP